MNLSTLSLQPCDTIPETPALGVLHFSADEKRAVHLCACGCGERIVTPTSGADSWVIAPHDDGTVTLNPEIRCASGAKYFICRGRIVEA